MLLRIGRRKTSYKVDDPKEFCEIEFWDKKIPGPDQHLSVYSTQDSPQEHTRAHAEHAASAGLSPPRGGSHLDVTSFATTVITTSGNPIFAFVCAAHREIEFSSPEDVYKFAHDVLVAIEPLRRSTILKDLREYVHGRLADNDREWRDFCATSSKGMDWASPKW